MTGRAPLLLDAGRSAALAVLLSWCAAGCVGESGGGADSGPGSADALLSGDAAQATDAPGPGLDSSIPIEVDCEAIWQRPGQADSFYEDNPTYVDPADDSADWAFSSPDAQGMNAATLSAAASDLASRAYTYSFLVIRHDAIVLEQYFNGSDARDSNNVHSASKSILSAVAGIAIDQGYIDSVDQPIAELLPSQFAGITDSDKRAITVRHLLTMTAGFAWTEDQTEYQIEGEDDWVQAILDLPLSDTPGDSFNYSTGQAHLVSAVITEATGTSLCEYAHAHLFGPLGITAEHWGRDPQGYFSGGYNLYLTPRELAKFGLLALHEGNWRGVRVVPQAWVEASVQSSVDTGGGWGYGYFWWLANLGGHDVQVAWGWGGQLVYVIPDLDVVAVITTNTADYSVDFDGSYVVEDYIIPSVE